MKQILMIVLFMVTLLGVTGCTDNENKQTIDENNLTITSGGENIKCIRLENTKDSLLENNKDFFKYAFEEDSLSNIMYIKNDEKVYLDFGSNPPGKLLIEDRILNSQGEYLYTDKETIEVPYEKDDNKFYFIVKKHPASGLSSISVENKTDFRGFSIKASWGNKEYVYVFVIKTDVV